MSILFYPLKRNKSNHFKQHKQKCIPAKKFSQKYKNISREKAPLSFNFTHIADAETKDFNNDTNLNDVLSYKNAQLAAKKIDKTRCHFYKTSISSSTGTLKKVVKSRWQAAFCKRTHCFKTKTIN